jgi:hypothetical protein
VKERAGALAKRVRRLVFTALIAACGHAAPEAAPVIVVGQDTITLDVGAGVYDVALLVRAGVSEFEPTAIAARSSDVLRIKSRDEGPHALAFDAAGLTPPMREFLDRTDQLRGPPLLAPGAEWVVSMKGAPPGVYTLRCLSHDGTLRISIEATGPPS